VRSQSFRGLDQIAGDLHARFNYELCRGRCGTHRGTAGREGSAWNGPKLSASARGDVEFDLAFTRAPASTGYSRDGPDSRASRTSWLGRHHVGGRTGFFRARGVRACGPRTLISDGSVVAPPRRSTDRIGRLRPGIKAISTHQSLHTHASQIDYFTRRAAGAPAASPTGIPAVEQLASAHACKRAFEARVGAASARRRPWLKATLGRPRRVDADDADQAHSRRLGAALSTVTLRFASDERGRAPRAATCRPRQNVPRSLCRQGLAGLDEKRQEDVLVLDS